MTNSIDERTRNTFDEAIERIRRLKAIRGTTEKIKDLHEN